MQEAIRQIRELGGDVEVIPESGEVYVWVNKSKLKNEDLALIRGFKEVRFLFLADTNVGDDGMEHLANLPLTNLWLSNTGVGDEGLRHLAGLTQLKDLLLKNTAVTDAGLKHLAGLQNLKTLHLEGTQVTDGGLKHIAALPALEDLNLERTKVTAEGLNHLRNLPKLRTLRLEGTGISKKEQFDFHASQKRRLDHPVGQKFRSLGGQVQYMDETEQIRVNFHGDKFNDAAILEIFAETHKFPAVSFRGNRITDAGVRKMAEAFVGFPPRELDFTDTVITDSALPPLAKWGRTMKGLTLDGTAVTNDGLRHLADWPKLTTLSLRGTNVDAQGLAHLQQHPSLITVQVNSEKISDAELKTFLAELPSAKQSQATEQ